MIILFITLLTQNLCAGLSDIILARGQTTKISVKPDERIHVTNRNVLRVSDQGRYITLTGLKLGYSTVVTRSKIYKILVSSVETAKSFERLKDLTENFKGLRLEVGTDSAELRGELLRFSDWEEVAEAARSEKLNYTFAAKFDRELSDKIQIHFKNLFARAELPPVRLLFENGAKAILPKELDSQKSQYKSLFAPWGFQIEKDNSTVALAPMVEVEILVAEVQKSFFRRFGMNWPQDYSFGIAPSTGEIKPNDLEFALQALEAKGAGRILASPKLLCRSGKEAEFVAGGEFPLAVRHKLHTEIAWKKHGVILKVKPLADLSGRMSIDIETEVSFVHTREKTENLPTFTTNRIKTHFDLEGSRTIVLSGLLKSIEANNKRGLPLLSDLPIIGSLFSSSDFLEDRTELVFFVTPRMVPYDTVSVERTLPKWREE